MTLNLSLGKHVECDLGAFTAPYRTNILTKQRKLTYTISSKYIQLINYRLIWANE